MILVTTGTSEYSFDRLFQAIECLCKEGFFKDEKVVVQCGEKIYNSNYFESFGMIDNDTFNKFVDESNYIISHAGTGSVIPALKKNKKVIVFPRLAEYNEHIDNHQLELAELFSKKKYILCANNIDELKKCILDIKKFNPKKFVSCNDKINDIIIDFINNL